MRRFGIAEIENDRIISIEEKPSNPKTNNVVYACYIFNKQDLSLIDVYLEEGNSPDAPGNFVSWLCHKSIIKPFIIDGYCIDIGTHESYEKARARQPKKYPKKVFIAYCSPICESSDAPSLLL